MPRSRVSVVTKPIICPVNGDLRLPSATIVAKRDIRPACQQQKKPQANVRHVLGNAGNSDSDEEYLLHQVPASGTSYNVTLTVSGQELCMEIDTGASLSLVSEVTYKKLWHGKRLLPTPAGVDPENKFVRTPLFDNLLHDEELQQRYSKAPTTLQQGSKQYS